MKVIYCNTNYECDVAVKCENDRYIKLYDSNGAEIASFTGIDDFSEYRISGGNFVSPAECEMPIPLSVYSLGGRTITTFDWKNRLTGGYYYQIDSDLISANAATCNVSILFKQGTDISCSFEQAEGKLYIFVDAAPLADVVIESIQVTRA